MLNWLPVKFRSAFKIATLAFKHFHGTLPRYLSDSLCTYQTSRTLRSSNEKLLKLPRRKTKSFGERSFSFQAPQIWNALPSEIRNLTTLSSFKSALKTHFFRQAYE